jgi:hypothetical protein
MFRKLAITALLGAASVEAFSPGAVFGTRPALRSPTCRNAKLGLRMQQDTEEYRPIIPTAENPMAPDYAKEPTQFERQGLVESSTNAPVTAMGEGGLTRREALGAGGAVGVGTLALIWAVTRNSGYDKADTSRDAGVAAVNTEAIKAPEVQASIEGLKASAAKLKELQDAFKADPNVQVSQPPGYVLFLYADICRPRLPHKIRGQDRDSGLGLPSKSVIAVSASSQMGNRAY